MEHFSSSHSLDGLFFLADGTLGRRRANWRGDGKFAANLPPGTPAQLSNGEALDAFDRDLWHAVSESAGDAGQRRAAAAGLLALSEPDALLTPEGCRRSIRAWAQCGGGITGR
jgi:hypothetical protein